MNAARPPVLRPAWVALAAGLVPLFTVHLCLWLSIRAGYVEACLPYLEGCTSISRAARFGLPNLLFKGLMLPCAALIAVFWWIAAGWARALHGEPLCRIVLMRWVGMIGALFLVLYATFLGAEGETYQWLRRYGVTVYFSFTVLAQMLLASLLPAGWLRKTLVGICALMLLLGIASIPLQHFAEDRDAALNAIEWCYALLMTTAFVIVGIDWRRRRVALRLTTRQP